MKKNYYLLLVSQFLSAFGDNAILAVILGQFLFRYQAGQINDADLGLANSFYTSLLFFPYIILAPLAGYFSDRYAKTSILISGNTFKFLGTLLSLCSVYSSETFQITGYSIIGAGACIYSPAKYGILREILPVERLVKANGTIEMLTIIAILTGTVSGALIIDKLPASTSFFIVAFIYLLSLILNFIMTPTPSNKELKLSRCINEFFHHCKKLFQVKRTALILVGTGLFWICGATMKMNFQPWGIQVLGYETNTQISLLGIWLSLGIMAGSIMSGQIHKVSDLSSARRYGIIMSIAIFVLSIASVHFGIVLILITSGIFGGLFLIPLNAALQAETESDRVGKSIALQNFIENAAMLCGGFFVYTAVKIGAGPQIIFLLLSILIIVVSSILKFPEADKK